MEIQLFYEMEFGSSESDINVSLFYSYDYVMVLNLLIVIMKRFLNKYFLLFQF